jgi:hypothetical protein
MSVISGQPTSIDSMSSRTQFDFYCCKIPLRPCYTVKQVSRYLYHATLCIMILVSLHTKSSSKFHAEFAYKLFPPKWRILTMKTLSYKLRRLSICSLNKSHHHLFPLSSHVLFTMCWPSAFICWWCCNLLTSNQDHWLVRDKMYRDPGCTE